MKNLFSYSGRLNRAPYFWYGVLFAVVFGILYGIFLHIVPIIARLIYVLYILAISCLVVRRFHDIEKPGWYFWLLLIPLYNIYLAIILLFKKGTAGPNAYGEDPLVKNAATPTAPPTTPSATPPAAQ